MEANVIPAEAVTGFLEARIAEDEAAARDGGSHNYGGVFARDNYGCLLVQPARVLAECKAKRAVIRLARKAAEAEKDWDDYEWQGTVGSSEPSAGDAILYALAAVYKDHPDYQQDWAL